MSIAGTVFDIQRFSVHDGPGIRTLVFLKGCSLRCEWCANPESQRFIPEILFDPARCIGCENCLAVCPHGVLRKAGDCIVSDQDRCEGCGECSEKCYAEARVLKGQGMTAEAVVEEVLKDEPFYTDSGGGITLSGGEPLDQPDFTLSILRTCRENAIHTAVETAGHVPWSGIEKIIPYCDLFLFDVKHTDPETMRCFTKADSNRIQENLLKLSSMVSERIVVRTPVIPGFNDTTTEILNIARMTKQMDINELHLLPYHRFGQGKYRLMGRQYAFNGPEKIEEDKMQTLKQAASLEGLIVQVGG